ncbi:MAG: peptidoglycan DD-metalloendopeptidase family protein [Candidatus Magasanikbacteria bacterium]|nr:peptidoglycan DD-metalloendopeptidase family protein [Candidatus Magasanikbacteria bacterium]
MRRILTIIIAIIAVGFFSGPFLAYTENTGGNKNEIDALNEQIQKRQEKIEQLEKSIEEYKNKIRDKQTEATSLSNQMAILDNRMVQVELDIQLTQEKMDSLSLEIESLELSIEEKNKVIEKQKAMISELIREIAQNDDKKYIEIMAAYDNFSDFYDRLQYLENVEEDLGKTAISLRLVKEELEAKKAQTEERRSAYAELKMKLDNKKKDLEEQVFQKQELLAQTQSSELMYKTLMVNLRKQYEQIETEISSIEDEIRKKLEEENKLDQLPQDGASRLSWPTGSRYITAYFHDKDYPYRNVFEHNAVDIRSAQGTAVKAAASGYVARAKRCSSWQCYSYVMIVHANGISTVYGHLSSINVSEDQFIARGAVLGYSGGSPKTAGAGPFTTGPHLHFEVRKKGIPVNPLNYLVKDY